MAKTLAILEVSQKQAYIFGSKYLRENKKRSQAIREATEELWKDCLSESLSDEEKEQRLVYAGGGHIILQFHSRGEAKETVANITRQAYTRFDGMEMFAKLMDYDPAKNPGENLKQLLKELEEKKNLRHSAFRFRGTGLEELDPVTFQPVEQGRGLKLKYEESKVTQEGERTHQKDFQELAGKDNFIAVVHIDGNNMGAKSQRVTESAGEDWETCCKHHRLFSESVDRAFYTALERTIRMVEDKQSKGELLEKLGFSEEQEFHPMQPVVAAGDDICFVTSGMLGIECAVYFLKALQDPHNPKYPQVARPDGKKWKAKLEPYSACAGVAMVHTKYPFHRAYELSEELCSSAKCYAAQLGENKSEKERENISTMDWHIEFGQGRGSVAESREDYLMDDSEDGSSAEHPIRTLTLRPLAVIGAEEGSFRSYRFFKGLFQQLTGNLTDSNQKQEGQKRGLVARSKLKGLRVPLKQGEWETKLYIRENQLTELEKWAYDQVTTLGEIWKKKMRTQDSFAPVVEEQEGHRSRYVRRALYFDALELVDHLMILEREEGK